MDLINFVTKKYDLLIDSLVPDYRGLIFIFVHANNLVEAVSQLSTKEAIEISRRKTHKTFLLSFVKIPF
jgi:hypothetical protein